MEGLDVKSVVGSYLNSCCLSTDSYPSKSRSSSSYSFEDSLFLSVLSQAATCCILIVTGFDIDVVTNYIYPTYSIRWPLSQETGNGNGNGKEDEIDADSFDFTNYSFPNDIWNQREDWEIAVKSVAVIPVAILALVGNFAVVRIIVKARLFRNPINMFILNMSIADFLCALFFPWIILATDLNQNFILGNFICRTEGFVLVTLMLASVLSLTSISYDRLTAVVFPFKQRMNRRMARITIWSVWLISLICASPLIIWRSYQERLWADYHEKWCTENKKKLNLYWPVVLIVLVWIPLAVLTCSYTAIVIKLDTLEKRQRDHPAQVKMKSKVVRMLFAIVIVYAIGWIPFSGFILARHELNGNGGEKVPVWFKHLYFISHYLMFVNSAVNPIIYGLKNDNLKREIRLALPAFLRAREVCEISAVYNNNNNKNQDNNGHAPGGVNNNNKTLNNRFKNNNNNRDATKWLNNRKDTRHNLWRSDTSSFDDNNGPASIVSLRRSSSALEDIGINVTSTLTKLTIPD